jgi:hypothetical protein
LKTAQTLENAIPGDSWIQFERGRIAADFEKCQSDRQNRDDLLLPAGDFLALRIYSLVIARFFVAPDHRCQHSAASEILARLVRL